MIKPRPWQADIFARTEVRSLIVVAVEAYDLIMAAVALIFYLKS